MLASSLHEQTSGSTGPSKVRTLLALESGALKAPVLLTPGRWTIGCSAENHIVLQGPAVASRHGLIIASGKRVLFRSWSQDSRLNGVPVIDAELTAGHTLQIGLLELRLREAGSSELIAQLPAVAESRTGLEKTASDPQPTGIAASRVFDAAASVARIDILAQAVEALSDELLGRDHGTQRLDELAGQIEASLMKPAFVRPDAAMTAGELTRPLGMFEAGPGDSSATSSDSVDAVSDTQDVSKAELRFRRRYEELHEYELRLAEREAELKQKLDQLHQAQAELARQHRDRTAQDTAHQDVSSSVASSELSDDIDSQASADDVPATGMSARVEPAPSIPPEDLAATDPATELHFDFIRQRQDDEQHHDEDLTEEQACFPRRSDTSAVRPEDEAARSREEAVRQLDELLLSITGRSDADRELNAAGPASAPVASPDSAVTSARQSAGESSDDVDQEIAATIERLQELEELLRMDLSDDVTLESEFAMSARFSSPAANHTPVDDESDFQCGRLSLSLPGMEPDAGQDRADHRPEAAPEQNHQPRWDDVAEEDASHFSQRFQSRGFIFADDSADLPQTVGDRPEPAVQNPADAAGADAGDGSDEVIARSPLLASLLRSRPPASESAHEVDAKGSTDAPHQSPATVLPGEGAPGQPVASLRHQLASLFNIPEPDSLPQEAPVSTEKRSQSLIALSPDMSDASLKEPAVSNESDLPPAGLTARTSNAANELEAAMAEEPCETEEPSIQDYMQQLLARSRRQGGDQSSVVSASSVEPAAETPEPDDIRLTDIDDHDKSWLQDGPLHAQDKKQVRERVAAFRDVANQSARAALIASRRRQLRIQVLVKSSAAVIALGSGIAALLAQLPKIFGYGVSALGLYFLLDLIVTLVRHGRKLIDYKAAARNKARLPAGNESPERSSSPA